MPRDFNHAGYCTIFERPGLTDAKLLVSKAKDSQDSIEVQAAELQLRVSLFGCIWDWRGQASSVQLRSKNESSAAAEHNCVFFRKGPHKGK